MKDLCFAESRAREWAGYAKYQQSLVNSAFLYKDIA